MVHQIHDWIIEVTRSLFLDWKEIPNFENQRKCWYLTANGVVVTWLKRKWIYKIPWGQIWWGQSQRSTLIIFQCGGILIYHLKASIHISFWSEKRGVQSACGKTICKDCSICLYLRVLTRQDHFTQIYHKATHFWFVGLRYPPTWKLGISKKKKRRIWRSSGEKQCNYDGRWNIVTSEINSSFFNYSLSIPENYD